MRRGMGDRRIRPRFEIVGELGGTLDTIVLLALRDVGQGGALVDSPVPLASGAVHKVTFSCDGLPTAVQVQVRHVRAQTMSTGEQRFLVGVEFATMTPALLSLIDRWVLQHGESAN